MIKKFKLDTTNLDKVFNITSDDTIIEFEVYVAETGNEGELNPFYNKKHTQETKTKISKKIKLLHQTSESFRNSRINKGERNGMYKVSRTGSDNPMFGKTHSEKTKQKISNKCKEWHKNNVNPRKGSVCSEKCKLIISEANSKEYTLLSPTKELVIVKNLSKFADDNNLNVGCLYHVVSGRNKSHKGWSRGDI